MDNFRSNIGHVTGDGPGRKAEVVAENAALAQLEKCGHCGDVLGQGINCAKCGLERIKRNQPRPSGMEQFRTAARQVQGRGDSGIGKLSAAAVAELKRRREGRRDIGTEGRSEGHDGGQTKEKPDMSSRMNLKSLTMPPLRRDDGGDGAPKPRKVFGRPATGPVKAGKFPCRNPSNNPHCSGTCGLEGGLCRSCGIRAGKQRGEPRATSDERLACPPESLDASAPAAMPLAVMPPTMPPAPAKEKPDLPAVAASAAEAGPLTMAVCDFFAACAHASERVEASLVLERRQVTVTVKFALP